MIEYIRASVADTEELTQRRLDYIKDDFGEISPEEKERIAAQLRDYFPRHLEKDLFAFVARDDGRIVATALLAFIEKPANPSFINGKIGEVFSVYTQPEYRGQGIASRLMKDLLAHAKEEGLDHVDLSATDKGYPMYKKLGFTERTSHYTEMRHEL